jgi:glycosyltransferase involved in cell wall biosynthesis
MARFSKPLVILPAWNEQQALPGVLEEIRAALPEIAVLVVNDASTDGTSLIARTSGVTVLDLPVNLGVGGAMRAGFKYALREGYDAVIQLDADGQHDPRSVASLIGTAQEHGADIVIGARFAGTGSYRTKGPRRWVMRGLSIVLSRLIGTQLTDTTSGFKLSGPRAVRLFAANYPAEYLGDTLESLVIAHRAGLTIRQVGVEMRPRSGGEPSHSPVRAAVFLMRAGLALAIALTRPSAPLPGEVVR